MPSRRETLKLGLLAGLGISGCDAPSLKLLRNSFEAPSLPSSRYGAPDGWIEQLPYSTMGVEIADQGRFISVLATSKDSRLTWVSGEKKEFITLHGRLVATRGLERDLIETQWLEPDPLPDLRAGTAHIPPRVYRHISLKAGKDIEENVAVESEFVVLGSEVITILGKQYQTYKVCEFARVRAWFWHTRNTFWIDSDEPIIWRSQQCYCPEVAAISMEKLKTSAA